MGKFMVNLTALATLLAASCADEDRVGRTLAPLSQPAMSAAEVDEGVQFEPRALGIVPGKTTSELRFTWYGGKGVRTGWIRLFKSDGSLVSTTKGTSGVVPQKSNNCDDFDCANDSMSYHKVAVTGLSKATEYEYSVSNDSVNWSYRKRFRTTSGGFDFTFIALGDAQVTRGEMDAYGKLFYKSSDGSTAACWRETMEKVVARAPDFILGLGDQVDAMNGDELEYDIFFSPPAMQSIPYAPVVGNHDVHAQFVYHYNPPYASSTMNAYSVYSAGVMNYYYLYNNILFVALHTGFYAQSVDGSRDGAKPHVTAMSETLASAKAEFAGLYDWLIVQHHKSTHSQSAQSTTAEIGYWVKAGFNKLMEDHGVDIVFSGHDHSYARSHVVTRADVDKAGAIDKDATSKDNKSITLNSGTVFFCLTTTSGVKYYPLYYDYGKNTEYPYLVDGSVGVANYSAANPTWASNVAIQNNIPQYTLCEVSGATIRVRTFKINDDANPVDEVTITKTSTPKIPVSILQMPRLVGGLF